MNTLIIKLPRLRTQLKPMTPIKIIPEFYFKDRSFVISDEHRNIIIVAETKSSLKRPTTFYEDSKKGLYLINSD